MNYDEYVLADERERIATLLKNNGYAEFENVYIQYDADTTVGGNQVDLTLRVENPAIGNHTVYHFNNTFITIQDRKSTRLTPVTNAHLVCRLLLEKTKQTLNT